MQGMGRTKDSKRKPNMMAGQKAVHHPVNLPDPPYLYRNAGGLPGHVTNVGGRRSSATADSHVPVVQSIATVNTFPTKLYVIGYPGEQLAEMRSRMQL